MATVYFQQPFKSTTIDPNKARHGEQGNGYGEVYIEDANRNIAAYVQLCPGLPSTVSGRYTEAATVAAAIVTALNAL